MTGSGCYSMNNSTRQLFLPYCWIRISTNKTISELLQNCIELTSGCQFFKTQLQNHLHFHVQIDFDCEICIFLHPQKVWMICVRYQFQFFVCFCARFVRRELWSQQWIVLGIHDTRKHALLSLYHYVICFRVTLRLSTKQWKSSTERMNSQNVSFWATLIAPKVWRPWSLKAQLRRIPTNLTLPRNKKPVN